MRQGTPGKADFLLGHLGVREAGQATQVNSCGVGLLIRTSPWLLCKHDQHSNHRDLSQSAPTVAHALLQGCYNFGMNRGDLEGGAVKTAQQLKALSEDLGSITSFYMVAHHYP